jgi:Ca-activated chloride channel homolog
MLFSPPSFPSFRRAAWYARACMTLLIAGMFLTTGAAAQTATSPVPYINAGPDPFEQIDFEQKYLDEQVQSARAREQQSENNKRLVGSGVVSALDLAAPNKAVEQFNRAVTLLKAQKSKEAIKYLQKAIQIYPKFVSAHNALGLAYLDQEDERAKGEFETAAKLDERFPGSFLNLGVLALSEKDFVTAESQLAKAASINPNDAKVLFELTVAQNGDHRYQEAVQTARRVHSLQHPGMASVHYVAAQAAMAVGDTDTVESQLKLLLAEAPTDPLAPAARQTLEGLARSKTRPTGPSGNEASLARQADSKRLQAELKEASEKTEVESCEGCDHASEPSEPVVAMNSSAAAYARAGAVFTVHRSVDETALYFAVSNHGHMVSDLQVSDIELRDDNKPPERIIQFIPQSKLPLRLGLLIDSSGSVHDRFSFEKRAARKFIEEVLNGTTDLGFVAGFSGGLTVTQDLVADPAKLDKGIEALSIGGGTALFDAVSYSCRKLADYPEKGRVARVLVVLSDGEDNSSHRSLKQSIDQAENAGVTVYAVSTSENRGDKSDGDRVLQLLAERSGGEAMFPGDTMVLARSLHKLRDLIRSRYLLAYKPAEFAPNGKYRTIHIAAERDGTHLRVHVRKGYYARVAERQN